MLKFSNLSLIQGIKEKNEATITLIYRKVYPMVKDFILRNNGCNADAEDIFQEFIHKSHVSVSLSDIVANFLIGQDLELTQNKLSILSKEEARIISIIREEKLSYLKIRFNKDHQIDLIESTRDQHIDKEARLIDLIMTNGYQDIEIKTEKGNIVKCQNTRKEKL